MITNDLVDGQPIKIGLKGISYFAIVLIVIDLFASIASIILIFAFKFPKPIDESVKTLGSSPLSDKSAKIY
ncbi:MAG: hypothetical protein MJ219_00175 [Mycoplasmoidaceae bacterium]|nr:hypothetical protein [Mycoplasmoidaceae bacterium]